MLKKLSLIFVLLLLLGCTNTSKKDGSLSPKEQLLEEKIYNWEVEDAENLFDELKPSLDPKKINRYEALITEKNQGIKDLKVLINKLKLALSKNQFDVIEQYTEKGIINKIKLNELEKLDLRSANIYTSDPKYNGNKADILALVNFYDESLYIDIVFNFKNGQWKIIDFSERGENFAR